MQNTSRPCTLIALSLSLAKAIEQSPGQDKGHEAAKHISNPQIANRTEEVDARSTLRLESKDKKGDQGSPCEVEQEARP